MGNLVGGLMAMVALSVCILQGHDPINSLIKGFIAFAVGKVLAQTWFGFISVKNASKKPSKSSKNEDSTDETENKEEIDSETESEEGDAAEPAPTEDEQVEEAS